MGNSNPVKRLIKCTCYKCLGVNTHTYIYKTLIRHIYNIYILYGRGEPNIVVICDVFASRLFVIKRRKNAL